MRRRRRRRRKILHTCIATLSGRNLRYLSPLTFPPPPSDSSGFLRWEYKIFSANVSFVPLGKTCLTSSKVFNKRLQGGVMEVQSLTGNVVVGVARPLLADLQIERLLIGLTVDSMMRCGWMSCEWSKWDCQKRWILSIVDSYQCRQVKVK